MTLQVKLFGGFSISCDGKKVTLGRNTTAKFVQLLQLVWLNGDIGISKAHIVNSLYDQDDLSNPNNSFNNLIFQMRKQMVAAGLPRKDYVVKRGKVYIPDSSVDLIVDATVFSDKFKAMQSEESDDIKYQLCMEALSLYEGELLPELNTHAWVITEGVRLQKKFNEMVRFAGEYAKKHNDFDTMFRVYEQAARIYPDDDWQASQIEALILKEEYKEAYRLYDATVRRYSDEMGLPPSQKMLENYKIMSSRLTSPVGHINDIQSSLQEDPLSGAYYCIYPAFIDIYRIMERNMERMGCSIYLMLCNLVDYAGKTITNKDKLEMRSETLRSSIGQSLRRGDIFTKYSASQYLVLLVGSKKEGCDIVADRITKKLKETEGTKADVHYSDVSMADLDRMRLK